MQQCDMGVPRGAGVDPQAQRMVTGETEVIRGTRIYEREPAGGIRVPGVGRDLVERGLQLRSVNHECEIYGARQSLGNCKRIGRRLADPGELTVVRMMERLG